MTLAPNRDYGIISESQDSTMPVVPLPRAGLSAAAIALLGSILAITLFFVLDGHRRQRETASQHSIALDGMIASPPPLAVPTAPPSPSAPKPVIGMVETARPTIVSSTRSPLRNSVPQPPDPDFTSIPTGSPLSPLAPSTPTSPALAATNPADDPVLIIDTGTALAPSLNAGKVGDGSEALANDESAVRATLIRNRTMLVPQGTIVDAVLETPIDSTRPGLVRAIIARDARGFDGSRVLIPRGSRLIGQTDGDVKPGQKRVLIMWTRLIRPDGVAIRIGSPASDTLGQAGIRGRVNNHFLARFTNAALQSALSAGVAIASRSSGNSYVYAIPGQISNASQSLFPDVPPGATIKVKAGAEIAVFVARDLDFSGTTSSR